MEETVEVEMSADEPVEESEDKKEAERLANWKANFPDKPTTDPDVVIPEGKARYPIREITAICAISLKTRQGSQRNSSNSTTF